FIQTTGNYTYDNNGNLTGDVVEEIQNIGWSVYGKMKTLTRISTSTRPELTFKYDASGNRVSKYNTWCFCQYKYRKNG
ncbi:MAG: hypothetical protein ACXVPD_14685, partial [Bacteroidia bacterium]